MRRFLSTLFVFSFGAAMTLAAGAQEGKSMSSKESAGTTTTDTAFVKKAARGGLAEVELGQLAVQKASSEEVKKFGQRMVDDHSKANDQLKQVAAQEHIDLPQAPSAKDKATKARLEKLSGEQFDKAYMSDMVKDHQKDVAEFEHESKTAKDPTVKSFAQQTLPTLRQHLKEAEKIAPKQQQAERTSGQ
ncbi:MAG TPA: DUF4142 domain-containing protein [Candidatus Sulfotelmatobacter sp.]|nr:DUF4142 domain-containing protein [Candidatus Sulfotelmatobacter sp.]